jgi:hypothetical protein
LGEGDNGLGVPFRGLEVALCELAGVSG